MPRRPSASLWPRWVHPRAPAATGAGARTRGRPAATAAARRAAIEGRASMRWGRGLLVSTSQRGERSSSPPGVGWLDPWCRRRQTPTSQSRPGQAVIAPGSGARWRARAAERPAAAKHPATTSEAARAERPPAAATAPAAANQIHRDQQHHDDEDEGGRGTAVCGAEHHWENHRANLLLAPARLRPPVTRRWRENRSSAPASLTALRRSVSASVVTWCARNMCRGHTRYSPPWRRREPEGAVTWPTRSRMTPSEPRTP